MKSKHLDISLLDFINLVEISTNSNKIHLDYQDYHSYCRKIGLSSYILNLVICRTRNAKTNQSDVIDKSFFVIDNNIKAPEQIDKDKQSIKMLKESVSILKEKLAESNMRIANLSKNLEETKKTKRRRVWPYWLVIVLLISFLIVLLYVILNDSRLRHGFYILLPFK